MPDAVESRWQDVEQEASDKLGGCQRHDALPFGTVAAIVLVAEGDSILVERDQTSVRDGDAMGIAREKASTPSGPAKGGLA